MSADSTETVLPPDAVAAPRLGCVLICDLADSTGLIERLGDRRATELIRHHDQLARDTLHRHRGQEIDKTDGFLILFDRPVQGVAFALEYQAMLAQLGEQIGQPLKARVGIHVGEVLTWRNRADDVAKGAKPVEVEGLAKSIAARLLSLAHAGQILLSESAYRLAFRAGDELPGRSGLRWFSHGNYKLQGVSQSQAVFEVGRSDVAPLGAPKLALKARRITPWWQWRPLYVVLAAITLLAVAYWSLKPTPAIAFAERDWLVLAPLNNRTGDTRFDQSLDTLIRVGLEQSRHVNLVSQHRLRQTLPLMRRPSDAPIDRELGIQLTLRTGARAMLLPTLSEVGGHLRFTTELIDPRSGATVYAHFVDSASEADLQAALGAALDRVRSDLGESVDSVEQNSLDLAGLTSHSFDALRAYSLALQAKSLSQVTLANELLDQALQLDPSFAMALSLQAVLRFMEGDSSGAAAKVEQAQAVADRLSPWEQAHLDAVSAFYRGSPDAITKWRALTARYPDRHSAHHTLAIALAADNQLEAAWQAIQPALSPLSGALRNSQYQAAVFALALGQGEQALALFRLAEQAGVAGDISAYALAELAAGDPQHGLQLARAGQRAESAEHAALNTLAEVSIQLRLGELESAHAGLLALQQQRAQLSAELGLEIALAVASWECLLGRQARVASPWAGPALMAGSSTGEQQRLRFRQALWQAVALHCPNRVAPAGTPIQRDANDVVATQLAFDWLEAESKLHSGQAVAALQHSESALHGHELWLLHHARRRAFEVLDNSAGAEQEQGWLSMHHGRSLVEFSEHYSALDLLNGLFLQHDKLPSANQTSADPAGPPH